jgi:hypothetical protein
LAKACGVEPTAAAGIKGDHDSLPFIEGSEICRSNAGSTASLHQSGAMENLRKW